MQSNSKEICNIVSKQTNTPLEIVTSINDVLFKKLSKHIRRPTKYLAFKISGLGTFYFRRARTIKIRRIREPYNDPISVAYKKHLDIILSLYDEYITYRDGKRIKKFGQESHDAFLMAKEQEKLSKKEEAKSKQHP